MSDGPEGCTSVEEWLAKGGTIKTEREHAVYEFTHEPTSTELEFVPDTSTSAPYRCRVTGVYGHHHSHISKGIRPYICAEHGCSELGRHQRNAVFWCDEHRNRKGKRTTR